MPPLIRRAVTCAILALLLCAGGAIAAPIAVEEGGLTPAQVEASHALVEAALARLPPGFLEGLPVPVSLRWRDDLPEDVHGRVRGGNIGLRRALLDAWMVPNKENNRPAALSALLHELGHVHDRSARGGLSRDARFLDLAGWPVRPLRAGTRAARNDFSDRSPDDYERHSPAEFFAVNFEHFLLDPEYACRRPALHRSFSAHFGWAPLSTECDAAAHFVGAGEEDAVVQLHRLDPARVQEVHYLFAEENSRPMSRWGHSMLRLVVCAPHRKPGEGCRFDLDHHLVLSFRAFVDDLQISSWRGLTGSYPSRLFVLPLQQVVDEYTKVELRGLQSLPLQLERAEIASLLERAAQVHWSYDGRYYFVSNNCAVETWKLLNDGVPRLSQASLRSVTPNGLLRRLVQEGIADASALEDAPRAVREGYYFESHAQHLQSMYGVARDALGLPHDDVQAWFADPGRRTAWLDQGDLRTTAALLVLEQGALRREEAAARDMLKRRLLRRGGADAAVDAAAARLQQLFDNPAYAGRPALLLEGEGYGLPQAREREALVALVAADSGQLQALRDTLHGDARALVTPGLRERLSATEANLALLGDRLRLLSAEAARSE